MKKLLATLALIGLLAAPVLARDISGSTVTMTPVETENDVETLCFEVYNASTDFEWLTDVTISLPTCMTILDTPPASATVLNGVPFNVIPDFIGYGTSVARWTGYDNYFFGFMPGGCIAQFCITVSINCACDNVYPIQWDLVGDGIGGTPHALNGNLDFTVLCSTPTEESDWSDIKSLY